MITENERQFKNRFLQDRYPALDLEVDDNGKVSDLEFPDGFTTEDLVEIAKDLLTKSADSNWKDWLNAR